MHKYSMMSDINLLFLIGLVYIVENNLYVIGSFNNLIKVKYFNAICVLVSNNHIFHSWLQISKTCYIVPYVNMICKYVYIYGCMHYCQQVTLKFWSVGVYLRLNTIFVAFSSIDIAVYRSQILKLIFLRSLELSVSLSLFTSMFLFFSFTICLI